MMGKVALSSGLQTNFFEVVQPLFNGSILQEPEKLNRVSQESAGSAPSLQMNVKQVQPQS